MFDIGVNLTSSQFAKDRDDVVARAFDAGVNGLLITGTNLRESQQAQKLARQYSSCWSTAGVHPHDSSQWQAATEEAIIELAAQPEVVAIGECGLDFNRNFSTPEEQETRFCCSATHCRRIKHAGIYALSRCPRAVYDIAGAVAG